MHPRHLKYNLWTDSTQGLNIWSSDAVPRTRTGYAFHTAIKANANAVAAASATTYVIASAAAAVAAAAAHLNSILIYSCGAQQQQQ